MSKKTLRANIRSTADYIRLFNGLVRDPLTDMEIQVLAAFVDLKKQLDQSAVKVNPFSSEMKKRVSDMLGRGDFNTLNNYIKKLKDKGAITPCDDGYTIHSVFFPRGEKEVVFKLIHVN
jgi:hypothetical protein